MTKKELENFLRDKFKEKLKRSRGNILDSMTDMQVKEEEVKNENKYVYDEFKRLFGYTKQRIVTIWQLLEIEFVIPLMISMLLCSVL